MATRRKPCGRGRGKVRDENGTDDGLKRPGIQSTRTEGSSSESPSAGSSYRAYGRGRGKVRNENGTDDGLKRPGIQSTRTEDSSSESPSAGSSYRAYGRGRGKVRNENGTVDGLKRPGIQSTRTEDSSSESPSAGSSYRVYGRGRGKIRDSESTNNFQRVEFLYSDVVNGSQLSTSVSGSPPGFLPNAREYILNASPSPTFSLSTDSSSECPSVLNEYLPGGRGRGRIRDSAGTNELQQAAFLYSHGQLSNGVNGSQLQTSISGPPPGFLPKDRQHMLNTSPSHTFLSTDSSSEYPSVVIRDEPCRRERDMARNAAGTNEFQQTESLYSYVLPANVVNWSQFAAHDPGPPPGFPPEGRNQTSSYSTFSVSTQEYVADDGLQIFDEERTQTPDSSPECPSVPSTYEPRERGSDMARDAAGTNEFQHAESLYNYVLPANVVNGSQLPAHDPGPPPGFPPEGRNQTSSYSTFSASTQEYVTDDGLQVFDEERTQTPDSSPECPSVPSTYEPRERGSDMARDAASTNEFQHAESLYNYVLPANVVNGSQLPAHDPGPPPGFPPEGRNQTSSYSTFSALTQEYVTDDGLQIFDEERTQTPDSNPECPSVPSTYEPRERGSDMARDAAGTNEFQHAESLYSYVLPANVVNGSQLPSRDPGPPPGFPPLDRNQTSSYPIFSVSPQEQVTDEGFRRLDEQRTQTADSSGEYRLLLSRYAEMFSRLYGTVIEYDWNAEVSNELRVESSYSSVHPPTLEGGSQPLISAWNTSQVPTTFNPVPCTNLPTASAWSTSQRDEDCSD